MVNSTTLAQTLASAAGVKIANAMTPRTDMPVTDEKLRLLVGEMGEQKSTFNQHTPGDGNQVGADTRSPFGGDEIFFSGMFPGARFQAKNGQIYEIESYDFEGAVAIFSVWYPRRERGIVSIQDIRKAIYAWTEPFMQVVPEIPVGADYGVLETKEV